MKASDIDMQDLALVYDDEYGPDYVAGILASEFPALDTDTNHNKVLGMLKEAARRGEEDYPLNFLANRIAELGAMKENKMKLTKTYLRKMIKEELLKEFGSEEYGLQTKEFEPIPEVEFQVGDEVDVMGSALAGAVGEVIEVTRTETGLPAIVLRLLRAADRKVYGGEGDEVIARPEYLEKRTDLFAQRMGRKAENPRRGPKKYYGVSDV